MSDKEKRYAVVEVGNTLCACRHSITCNIDSSVCEFRKCNKGQTLSEILENLMLIAHSDTTTNDKKELFIKALIQKTVIFQLKNKRFWRQGVDGE